MVDVPAQVQPRQLDSIADALNHPAVTPEQRQAAQAAHDAFIEAMKPVCVAILQEENPEAVFTY
jgi:hypothetical protein